MKKTLSLLVLGLVFYGGALFGEPTPGVVAIPYGKALVTNQAEAKNVFSSFFGGNRAKYIHGSALYTSAMSEFAQEVFSKLGTTPEKWLALTEIDRVERAEVDAGWEHILKENLRSFLMTRPNIEQKGRFLDISPYNFRESNFLTMNRLVAEGQKSLGEVMVNTKSENYSEKEFGIARDSTMRIEEAKRVFSSFFGGELAKDIHGSMLYSSEMSKFAKKVFDKFGTTPEKWLALTEIDRVRRVEVDAGWEHILKENLKLFVDGKPTEAQVEKFLNMSIRFRDSDANIIDELYEKGRKHLAKRRFRDLSLIKKIVNLAKGEGRVVRNVVNQKTNSQTKIDPKKTAARVGKK